MLNLYLAHEAFKERMTWTDEIITPHELKQEINNLLLRAKLIPCLDIKKRDLDQSNYNVSTWKQKISENGKVKDGLPLHNYISAGQQRSHHNNPYSQLCKMIHALITSDTSHWSISALKAKDSKHRK